MRRKNVLGTDEVEVVFKIENSEIMRTARSKFYGLWLYEKRAVLNSVKHFPYFRGGTVIAKNNVFSTY